MKWTRFLAVFFVLVGLASVFFPVGAEGASTQRFYSLSSDGSLYATDNVYATAQDADSGTVEYTTTAVRIGQENATDYTVWRGVFFFDTQELPEGSTVSSAQVTFQGKADHSDADFDLVLVQPGDMHSPLEADDYGVMNSHTTALSDTFNTIDYASTMELELNGNGVAALMKGGITVFGLRSQEDINASAPAGEEYIDLYSSESSNPPILTVNYYTQIVLGEPDTKDLTSVAIFRGYYEDNDTLYVARSNINYESGISDLDPTDYFSFKLMSGNVTIASVPLWSWGYVPVSIYLSAANTPPTDNYTLMVAGNPDKFLVDVPYAAHTISSIDYKGTDLTALDAWVMATAIDIGHTEADDINLYRTSDALRIQVTGGWVLNDEGGDMFISGIPLLDSLRGHLFANPNPYSKPETAGNSYEGTLWANWGPSFMADWELIGNIANLSGMVAASLAFLGLGAVVIIVVQKETGKPALGMIPATGVLLLGSLLGVPLFIILGATALSAAYFYKELLMGQSA